MHQSFSPALPGETSENHFLAAADNIAARSVKPRQLGAGTNRAGIKRTGSVRVVVKDQKTQRSESEIPDVFECHLEIVPAVLRRNSNLNQ